MGRRSSRDGSAHIPSDITRCKACGDPVLQGCQHCKTCNDELKYGIIPPLKPGKMLGTGNTEPAKHDSDYHGGRFHEGEW